MDDTSSNKPSDPSNRKAGKNSFQKISSRALFWILIALAFTLIHMFLFPSEKAGHIFIPQKGKISEQDIIAPFTFDIIKDDIQLKSEQKTARENIPEVLVYSDSVYEHQLDRFESMWTQTLDILDSLKNKEAKEDSLTRLWKNLSSETISTLVSTRSIQNLYKGITYVLDTLYSQGFMDAQWKQQKTSEQLLFSVFRGNSEQIYTPQQIATEEDIIVTARRLLGNIFIDYPPLTNSSFDILKEFLSPNLLPDETLTAERRQKAAQMVSPTKGEVLIDEKIVGVHERVTEEIYEKLYSLEKAYELKQQQDYPFLASLVPIGRFILLLLVIGLFFIYLQKFQKHIVKEFKHFILILLLILVQTTIVFLLNKFDLALDLVPISLTAILLVLLFSLDLSFSVILTTGLICGILSGFNLLPSVYIITAGFFAAFLFRKVSNRQEVFKPILLFVLYMVLFIISTELINFDSPVELLMRSGIVVIKSFFVPLVTFMLVPLFENLTGITTNLTLAEYGNSNSPLLQQLSIEAPGTYQHCVIVGNLSEAGAIAINANSLLAKTGGLYHDIGKITNPGYFNENQKEDNPHYKLSPRMSFLVIKNHVKEGVELAKAHKIPKPIIDIIQQHHGTTLMEFFYQKALQKDETLREADFRYNGPKPQTQEACLVFLADAVEAATRELDNPSLDRINQLVMTIFDKRFNEGELDECGITLKDLNSIKDIFVPILSGVHHKRNR
ncbi:HDIG domain-containing protein [bacterium]|nr:HDIG domain-containing protein [bacterium]